MTKPRKFKDGRAPSASSMKRAARKEKTSVKAVKQAHSEASVIAAGSAFDAYRAFVNAGHTQADAARHFGVSRQVISQAMNPAAHRKRANAVASRRYHTQVGEVREHRCSLCDKTGHNAATCEEVR